MNFKLIVSSGSPLAPYRFVTWYPSIVPTVRFTLRIGRSSETGLPCSSASRQPAISSLSSALPSP